MTLRKRLGAALVLGLTPLIALLGQTAASNAQDKPIVLRVADHIPVGHDINVHFIKVWMDTVTKATNGAVKFEHYPSEQLGKARDMLSLTMTGVVDVGLLGPSYFPELPLSGVVELPRTSGSSCEYTRAFHRILDEKDGALFKNEYGPLGFRTILPVIFPANQIFSTKKFENVKDFEGMKLQTQGGAKESVIRSLKAVPVQITNPELFESLSRGTIDGGVLAIASVVSYKLPIKFVTRGENFGTATALYGMSEANWKKLPANIQKALMDAGKSVSLQFCAYLEKSEDANYEKLEKMGAKIVRFAPADRKALAENIIPIQKQWAETQDKRGKAGTVVSADYEKALSQK